MRTTSILTLLTVALGAAPALADIPPPSTYVETCTIAQQQTATSECLTCSAYYGDSTRCSKLLNTYCYHSLCKTWGASAWSEVLCRTKTANAPVVPSDVIAILSSSMTPAPSADGGTIPASCAPYTAPTGTATATVTSTPTITKSGTTTQSTTDSKTSTATQSSTETKSSTTTASATDSKTSTGTQIPTETKSATDSKSNTATASPTATATVTQTVVVTQSGTSTQSATAATSTGTQTSTSPNKSTDDSSGCSVTTGKSAVRALGPLSVVLAGLALLVLRRRRRR
jgi:MYXO-CTERM domain-containing protein